jgi:hypothetical protein
VKAARDIAEELLPSHMVKYKIVQAVSLENVANCRILWNCKVVTAIAMEGLFLGK